MIKVLEVATGVATPLGLLGLVAALAYFAYSLRLKAWEKVFAQLPLEARERAADTQLTRYGIDAQNFTREKKIELIRIEMKNRYDLSRFYAALASIVVVFCFAIAALSYVAPIVIGNSKVSHPDGPIPKDDRSGRRIEVTPPVPLTD